jgi:tRNA(His) guanylyltransferase
MPGSAFADNVAAYEVLPAQELLQGRPIVARLIGRRFEALFGARFDRPFDGEMGKMLVKTLSHLCSHLGATYGYAERTEMSLFAVSNGGEARRLISRIGGEAAAKMSLLLGDVATFDTRLYQFDRAEAAGEYFAWRRREAEVTAIDAYCSHVLSAQGAEFEAVPRILEGMGSEEKVELLRQNDFDFARVPPWQREGVGVYVERNGSSSHLVVDLQLPAAAEYHTYLRRFVA